MERPQRHVKHKSGSCVAQRHRTPQFALMSSIHFWLPVRLSPRDRIARFFIVCGLWAAALSPGVQAQTAFAQTVPAQTVPAQTTPTQRATTQTALAQGATTPNAMGAGFSTVGSPGGSPALGGTPVASEVPAVSNANPADSAAIAATLERLRAAAQNRDINALAYFRASVPADAAALDVRLRTSHIAVSYAGALVRLNWGVTIVRSTPILLSSGTQDLWLSRSRDGSFALSTQQFVAPPDAIASLVAAADSELKNVGASGSVLDLVASRVGGRWIALRRQRWDGEIAFDASETTALGTAPFLAQRMVSAPKGRALTGHFMLQKGMNGWFGVGAAFDPADNVSTVADALATSWRDRLNGSDFLRAEAHRDFALALNAVGLWNEAADELQKADLMQPGLVGPAKLREAATNRARDPQNVVARQLENEQTLGLGAEHPYYLISALQREQQVRPDALRALRLALEYSRLGDDARATAQVKQAQTLIGNGTARRQDEDWIQLLFDHLAERGRLSRVKPSNIVRSSLFTVRVWPGSPTSVLLLASLEEAQHTVYADFGLPMGNTEVLLWRSQDEFARYTTQFAAQGGSEFVAALTLTKLVSTATGPRVLSEEINAFADTRDPEALFSTIAHEYGHVAVRQLAQGRLVPVWFNEGIAAAVEGGYDGYLPRVRRAANANALLSMSEMLQWNVDGERAFLAYSQANSMIDFIVARWGKQAVINILKQIGRDATPESAFRSVLGLTQGQLYERWVQEGITR
jgi:hypothetical protein